MPYDNYIRGRNIVNVDVIREVLIILGWIIIFSMVFGKKNNSNEKVDKIDIPFARGGTHKNIGEHEKYLEDKLTAKHLSKQERFNNIIKCARKVLEEGDSIPTKGKEHPIFDFIRILGRGLQSNYLKSVFYYDMDSGAHEIPPLEWKETAFRTDRLVVDENGKTIKFDELFKEVTSKKKINLSKDLILPWPWRRDRLLNALQGIGAGRSWGKWTQDTINHDVTVWLPMGICWVQGGNHSIAVGIIQGGELLPEGYIDISNVYKYVKCDGNNYIRIYGDDSQMDRVICEVKNIEIAVIFEIGRMLSEKGISFTDYN